MKVIPFVMASIPVSRGSIVHRSCTFASTLPNSKRLDRLDGQSSQRRTTLHEFVCKDVSVRVHVVDSLEISLHPADEFQSAASVVGTETTSSEKRLFNSAQAFFSKCISRPLYAFSDPFADSFLFRSLKLCTSFGRGLISQFRYTF